MTIRLLVARQSGDSGPDQYFFDQDCITIGRDAASSLVLPDSQRVVSKQHAEVRRQNGTAQLVDLGSKNFTFLNGRKMLPNVPYELHSGDSFSIGEFNIAFEQVQYARPDYDRTVFDASFINAFEEDAEQLATALRNIRTKFEGESPSRRVDALRDALDQAGLRLEQSEADQMIAAALGVDASPMPAGVGALPKEFAAPPHGYAASLDAPPRPFEAAPRSFDAPARPQASAPPAPPPRAASSFHSESNLDRLLNISLRAISKLTASPGQFRHEFIGQTMMHTADHAALTSGDEETVKGYLLDPTLDAGEAERRAAVLESLAGDVVLHQLGLLDGYKASVQEGSRTLLDELNPEAVENAVGQQNAVLRMNGTLRKARAFELLQEKWSELQGDNWSVAERRVFRPAFIRSYLSRITNSRR